MKRLKKFNLQINYLTATLIFVLILLLIGTYFLTYPIFKNTQLYNTIRKTYQNNVWVTFTSNRTKFSFEHPISWPVIAASDEQLKENNIFDIGEVTEIENIDFEEEWVKNAGGPRLGFMVVQKISYKTLKDYVDELSQEKMIDMYIKGRTQKVTIKPPKIEYLKIGGLDAISVTDTNAFASFTKETADYRLIKNGWLYRFVTLDSSRFLENKEKNSKTL